MMHTGSSPSNTRAVLAVAGFAIATGPALAQGDPLVEPFPERLDLEMLSSAAGSDGSLGASALGLSEFEKLGFSVAIAGDLNGDGLADIAIGALASEGYRQLRRGGEAYVVFGRVGGLGPDIDLASLDGSDGFRIGSIDPERPMGYAVSAAGDVNGDGLDDLVIGDSGTHQYSSLGVGGAAVIFGRDVAGGGEVFPDRLVVEELDGVTGFQIPDVCQPISSGTHCAQVGASVAGLGDVNGDGIDDLALGSPNNLGGRPFGSPGAVYVVFGRVGGFPAELELGTLPPDEGLWIVGADSFDRAGRSVAGVGDINGDGFNDIAIGSSGANRQQYCYGGDPYECYSVNGGRAHVVFGRGAGDPFSDELQLSTLDGTRGFALDITNFDARLGASVCGAGDLNGDGIADLAFGAPGASHTRYGSTSWPGTDHGRVYVVFGRSSGSSFPASMALDSLSIDDGFVLSGPSQRSMAGFTVSAAGDVTDDGLDDLIIAMPGESDAFLLLGRDVASAGPFDPELEPDELAAEGRGAYFDAPGTGHILRTGVAGSNTMPTDINGDGRRDLVIGAPGVAPTPFDFTGAAYIVYGRGAACQADLDGDGRLTLFDFLEFQNLFDAGDPVADFDGDGRLTLFDFLAFQNAFDAGCG